MFTKLQFLFGICLILLTSTCVLSQIQELSSAEALQRYRESLSYSQSVSMKIQHRVDSNDNELFPQTLDFVFRQDRDNNRAEWIGKRLIFRGEGNIDLINSDFVKDIADGNMLVSLEGMRLKTEGLDSRRVILWYKYTEKLKELLENPNFGGPLFGKMYGSNYKSVADLLGESPDLHIRNKDENINGVACFVLEGTSKYGKATAWIAPEKGYNAMKWVIEKGPHHLFDDTVISTKWPSAEGSKVVFNSKELHEVIDEDNTVFIPKFAHFTHITYSRGGNKNVDHYEYKTSDIQLKPNFEALGAFKIDLPDGIRVFIRDFPSMRYRWQNGKPVPNFDKYVIQEIDKMVDDIITGKVPPALITDKKTEVAPNEPSAIADTEVGTQADTVETQREVSSESASSLVPVSLLIGLLIVGVIGWLVFRQLKRSSRGELRY